MPLVETTVMDIQILSKIFFIFMSIEKFAFIVFILFAGRDIQIKNYITKHNSKYFRNFGITFLVPYNKDFGRITRFLGNDLATVLFAAFCYELCSNNSL